jgi:hypothetical protein
MVPQPKGKAYEQHATKEDAGFAIYFAAFFGGVNPDDCGVFARDPRLHPSEPNILPALTEKAARRAKRKSRNGMSRK